MVATSSTPLSLSSSSSSNLIEGKASLRQCLSLPTLSLQHQKQPHNSAWKATIHCHKIVRDVAAMATGEVATKELATEEMATGELATAETSAEVAATELPQVLETIQEAWNKLDDKFAVTSLGVAAAIALWGSAGMVSAIDRLPLVPGVLELVGIGYTGWFAYKKLLFKPDREALIKRIKGLYSEII